MIILKNKGEIDIDLITTMGVNVKEGDSIGYFGTGLKYAIAVFLREKIPFSLFIGGSVFGFITETKVIRGKEFEICVMSGEFDSIQLGFTTELGKNWEPWQAYREIHSNCLDENGEIFTSNSAKPQAGYTTFLLPEDEQFSGVFLQDTGKKLIHKTDEVEVYEGASDWIYYRGIRAKNTREQSIYTYNLIKPCVLTEDRLLCYDHQAQIAIGKAVAQCNDTELLKTLITSDENTYEASLDMGYWVDDKPSEAFNRVLEDNKGRASTSARQYYEKNLPKVATTNLKDAAISTLQEVCETYELQMEYDGQEITINGEILS